MSSFQVGIQVIIRKGDAILLGQRKKPYGRDTWGLPGGHLEFGESFEAAAAREVGEETSLTVKSTHILGVINDPSLPYSHHIQIGMVATDWTGEVNNSEPHLCHEWKFCPLENLPHPLFSSSAPLIDLYLIENPIQKELAR
jgi:8-oxo-dGTP diphosphatase